MSEREDIAKERLLEAIATSIIARQGKPNREQAKHILEEIEASGWRIVPKMPTKQIVNELRTFSYGYDMADEAEAQTFWQELIEPRP